MWCLRIAFYICLLALNSNHYLFLLYMLFRFFCIHFAFYDCYNTDIMLLQLKDLIATESMFLLYSACIWPALTRVLALLYFTCCFVLVLLWSACYLVYSLDNLPMFLKCFSLLHLLHAFSYGRYCNGWYVDPRYLHLSDCNFHVDSVCFALFLSFFRLPLKFLLITSVSCFPLGFLTSMSVTYVLQLF